MKPVFTVFLAILLTESVSAQTTGVESAAAKTLQPSEVVAVSPSAEIQTQLLQIPSGTPIEVETAYTVSSIDMKPGDSISFRVVIPVIVDGVTVIEKGALVTARVILAKRGGHWGKAGKLAWSMEDVIGADNSRIPLAPETHLRNDAPLLAGAKSNSETRMGQGSITGISHGGEVATKTIVTAALMPLIAPVALMNGFRRGENAVLPEGKRFVVIVRTNTNVKTSAVSRLL